jgi:predicted Zn-ribbon and HTH transcriptional regulator
MQYDGYLILDDSKHRLCVQKTEPTQADLQKIAAEIEKETGRQVSGFWIDRVTPEEPIDVEMVDTRMEKALKHLMPFTTCKDCGIQIPRIGLRGAVRCDKCRLKRNRLKKREYYDRRKKLMRPRKIYDSNTPLT